jgi:putative aldouronate transport system substrate-binding protein
MAGGKQEVAEKGIKRGGCNMRGNRMKKLALAILAVVLVATAAFARGEQQAAQSPGGGPRNITVFVPSMGPIPRGLPEVQEAINKIVEPSGIQIKLTPVEIGSWEVTIPVMMASQEKIDLLLIPPSPGGNFNVMISQNQLMDITDTVTQYAPDLIRVVQAVTPAYLDGTKINGRLFGVAGLYSKVNSYYYLARADLLDKYNTNIYDMKSLDDVEAFLLKVKAGEPSLAPLAGGLNGAVLSTTNPDVPFFGVPFEVYGIGGIFADNPYEVVNQYNNEPYKNQLRKLRDWYLKGLIYKDAAINVERPEELVKSNIVASWFVDSEIGVEATKSAQTGKPIRAVKIRTNLVSTALMRKYVWAVPSYSKEAEMAVKFLNLLYSRADLTTLLTWGIEGRDYVLKSDGTAAYPAGVTAQTVPYHSMDHLGGNQYLVPPWTGNPPDLRQQALKENQAAAVSPLFGFSYDPTPVQLEVVAADNAVSQYRPGIDTGSVDPEVYLPVMNEALDKAGGQKILDEIQRQLDAWRAANKK